MRSVLSRQRGLSLIELMVAITLGLLLSLAVVQVFLSSRGVFRMQDSVSRIQESARFAMSALTQDIRMAGFMGCPSVVEVTPHIIASSDTRYDFGANTVLVGSNNVAAGNTWNAVEGTDVITLRKASSNSARLAVDKASGSATITLAKENGSPSFANNDVLIISDCVSADMFRATNVDKTGASVVKLDHASDGTIANTLKNPLYGTAAEVFSFESLEYFIGDTGRTTPISHKPIYALFVRRLTSVQNNGSVPSPFPSAYELVDGVENMQLTYGVDTAGNDQAADAYKTADQIAASDWTRVVSVRIDLLMQGTDDNAVGKSGAQVQTLSFNGASLPNDGRLRQVFSSTIAIRNRTH